MSMEQFKPMTDLVESICVNTLDSKIIYTTEPYKKAPEETWITVQSKQGFPAILLRNAWLSQTECAAEEADNCLVELLTAVSSNTRLACQDIIEGINKIPQDFVFTACRRNTAIHTDLRAGELSIIVLIDGRVQWKP